MLSPQLTVIGQPRDALSVGRGLSLQNLIGIPRSLDGSVSTRIAAMRLARKMPRVLASLLIAASMVTPGMAPPVEAAGQTRTLKLYFIHTEEKASITFKRNGRYDARRACSRSIVSCATGAATNRPRWIRVFSISSGKSTRRAVRAIISTSSPPTARRPPTACCGRAPRAWPRRASTCSARRWISICPTSG